MAIPPTERLIPIAPERPGAMSDDIGGTAVESAVEQLRAEARELRRAADELEAQADELERSRNGAGDAGGDSDGSELECEHCGREMANAGAKAMHEQACDGGDPDAGGEPQDGEAISADGLDASDVPAVVRNASDAKNRKTAERYNREPGERDAGIADTAAKALVNAMGGEKSQYRAAFDTCERDECDRGCNGLHATLCWKHQKAAESDGDSGEDARNDAGDGESETGASGSEPAEIAEYVRDEYALGPIAADRAAKLASEGTCASIAAAVERVREGS